MEIGMVRRENGEEWLPFKITLHWTPRCCYCYYWNPARKQRPVAPRWLESVLGAGVSPRGWHLV